jgi:hypothetical protein
MRCPSRWAIVVGLVVGSACKSAPDAQGTPTEDPGRAEERMNLLSNPSLYLSPSEREYDERDAAAAAEGETPAIHQLTSMAVYNSSRFAVRDLGGDVVWLDEHDRRLGSTPFRLSGTIGPGQAKRFATNDGTMESGKLNPSAASAQVVFTHVRVVADEKSRQ